MGKLKYSYKSAHPVAKQLMPDKFYWSTIDEFGPFGNDDGWEAITDFPKWRKSNLDTSPIEFLYVLISRWGYPSFDWNELNPEKIMAFIEATSLTEKEIQEYIADMRKLTTNSHEGAETLSDDRLRKMAIAMPVNVNLRILLGYDNAITGTAFAQIALEGSLHEDLRYLAATAINRQLLPVLINNYDESIKEKRISQLQKMLEVIIKVP